MMRLFLLGLAVGLLAPSGSAQHHGSHSASPDDPHAVAETFVVTGLRLERDALPPGSGVGRAGLRFGDGGYVSIVHGKPYARGRQVWGGLVGYGQVWAAGAHRATELVTTVPLVAGGTRIEPGVYSLFVTPHVDTWTLHVNRSLGMHLADEYDADNDLATADAPVVGLLEPVEGLTWSFSEDGLSLRLAWADRAAFFALARAH